jgi:hypothetical protein
MTRSKATGRFTRSIRALFSPPKTNSTQLKYPERYYKQVWLDKPLYEAIDFLAKVNRTTRMKMLHDTLQEGLAYYIGAKIAESNRQEIEQRNQGRPVRPTPFVTQLTRLARSKGKSIDQFF